MKPLIEKVQKLSLAAKHSTCQKSFLNNTVRDIDCQSMVQKMTNITPEMLGVTSREDPYHFAGPLNRVTIDCNEQDYRLVLFFIKKGTRMPLHDHPNMAVFFRLVFGELNYVSYDKLDDKFKYNDFADDEYAEMLDVGKRIKAKKSKPMSIKEGSMLYVRPSVQNMHEFVAQENSCFFDICLPNYTPVSHERRITYFKETGANELNTARGGTTELEYYTTPPVLPTNFSVNELEYRGALM